MKVFTIWLSSMFLLAFGSIAAKGRPSDSPQLSRGGFWEFSTMSLVQPLNAATFYSTNRGAGGVNSIRTELYRQNGWMQRASVRGGFHLNQNWQIYGMYDVAYLSYNYGSREFFSDGSLYRIDRYTGNDPSRSIQQAASMGVIYQQPINERLKWRVGGGAGVLMGIFEEEIPWLNSSLLGPNFTGSFRLATQWEAGIDWRFLKKHKQVSLLAGYVMHYAFLSNEQIVNHHLPFHHGLQLGIRYDLKRKQATQRRSDLLGF